MGQIVLLFYIKTNSNLMKNLQITKMVSVFSRRSMIACIITGGILSLNSCDNKDQLATQPLETLEVSVAKGVTLKENRLIFENVDAFKQYRKTIDKKNNNDLVAFDKQLGLESHLSDIAQTLTVSNNSKMSNEIYQKVEKRVRDPYLASMLNKNRELQIGNTIYRCNADYIFEFQEGEEKFIEEFYDHIKSSKINIPDHQTINFKSLKVAKTDVKIEKITSVNSNPKAKVAYNCEVGIPTRSDLKMGGEKCTEWYLFYSSASLSTCCLKYDDGWWFFGGWGNEEADYVSIRGTNVALYYNGPQGNFNLYFPSIFVERYRDAVASYTIDYFVGIPFAGEYIWQGGTGDSKCVYGPYTVECSFGI
jgi:hypothetical protein